MSLTASVMDLIFFATSSILRLRNRNLFHRLAFMNILKYKNTVSLYSLFFH